jgi:hypothetical protein
MREAVEVRMLFTSSGLSVGSASNINAIVPAMNGVAIEVPLICV